MVHFSTAVLFNASFGSVSCVCVAVKTGEYLINNVKIEWTETSAIASGVLTVGTPETVRTEITDGEEELSGNEYD